MDQVLKQVLSAIKILLLLILSVGFLGIGMLHLVALPEIVGYFDYWKLPLALMYSVGVVEVLGSIALYYEPTRYYGGFALLAIMVGALVIHIKNGEYNPAIIPAAIGLNILLFLFIHHKLRKEF